MISAPGIGSGLDVGSIVDQLMSLERRPLNQLEANKRDFETQLSAFGKLKSALSTFQSSLADLKTVGQFSVFKADSSDTDTFTATADSTASAGAYNVQVTRLAQAHKLASVAIADTDTTTLGSAGDDITLTVNSVPFTVAAGGMTLTQIRDAINSAPDNSGVSASILQETSTSYRLILTSSDTGDNNAISTSFTGTLGTDLGLTDINTPGTLDSEIVVDGFTLNRSGNTISDAISGVTLNLLAEDPAVNKQLTVSRDVDTVKETVQAFVDAYNELQSTIDGLSGEGNDLEADSTLRGIENRLRGIFNTTPAGLTTSLKYLSEAGISFQRDGTLSLDSGTLDTVLGSDFAGISELFGDNDQGYAFRLDVEISNLVQTDGLIDNREDGLNTRIGIVDGRISDMELRLTLIEERLRNQFTALDTLMGQLQGTSTFLTQQLAALPTLKTG